MEDQGQQDPVPKHPLLHGGGQGGNIQLAAPAFPSCTGHRALPFIPVSSLVTRLSGPPSEGKRQRRERALLRSPAQPPKLSRPPALKLFLICAVDVEL